MKSTYFLAAAGGALALSACGGGGGSAGSPAAAPVSMLSYIAPADAQKVASNGYTASALISQSSSSLSDIVTGVSVAPPEVGVVTPVLGLVKRAFHADGASLLTGVTVSEACSGGGTMTIDANLHSQNGFSNGDTLTMTTNSCVENGDTMHGTVSITVSGVSGDLINTTTGAVTLGTQFTSFSIATGSTTDTLNGDMKIGISATGANDMSFAISGTSLQVTEQNAGATVADCTLATYSVTSSVHGTTVSDAANFSLSGTGNGLGQFAYTVKNLQPFVGTTTADLPTAGALIVNGNASSVTATVVSNGVRLDYSAKGDGVITQTSTVAWSDFLPRL